MLHQILPYDQILKSVISKQPNKLSSDHPGHCFKVSIADIHFEKYFIVHEENIQTTAPCEVNLTISGQLADYINSKDNKASLTLTGNLNLAKALAEYIEHASILPHAILDPILGSRLSGLTEKLAHAIKKGLKHQYEFLKNSQNQTDYSAFCQHALNELEQLEKRVKILEDNT